MPNPKLKNKAIPQFLNPFSVSNSLLCSIIGMIFFVVQTPLAVAREGVTPLQLNIPSDPTQTEQAAQDSGTPRSSHETDHEKGSFLKRFSSLRFKVSPRVTDTPHPSPRTPRVHFESPRSSAQPTQVAEVTQASSALPDYKLRQDLVRIFGQMHPLAGSDDRWEKFIQESPLTFAQYKLITGSYPRSFTFSSQLNGIAEFLPVFGLDHDEIKQLFERLNSAVASDLLKAYPEYAYAVLRTPQLEEVLEYPLPEAYHLEAHANPIVFENYPVLFDRVMTTREEVTSLSNRLSNHPGKKPNTLRNFVRLNDQCFGVASRKQPHGAPLPLCIQVDDSDQGELSANLTLRVVVEFEKH